MRETRGRVRHPLLDTKQRIGQMNVEVSLSRRGLDTNEFTQAGGEKGGTLRYNTLFFFNCQLYISSHKKVKC